MLRAHRHPTPATPGKIVLALALGFSASVACAAATAPTEAQSAEVHPLTPSSAPSADALGTGNASTNRAADGKYPGCPHGALEDPHRGFVRCLGPGEKSPFPPDAPVKDGKAPGNGNAPNQGNGNAGNGSPGTPAPSTAPSAPLPPLPSSTPSAPPAPTASTTPSAPPAPTPSAAPSAPPAPTASTAPATEPPKPGPPPVVEMKAPKFENGDVPKAEKNLTSKKVLEGIARCVSEGGGVTGRGGNGTLKVTFLVRAQGKAEGVEVDATGVSADAAKCVRTLLKNRAVGTPSADPVGVTVVYTLKPAGK